MLAGSAHVLGALEKQNFGLKSKRCLIYFGNKIYSPNSHFLSFFLLQTQPHTFPSSFLNHSSKTLSLSSHRLLLFLQSGFLISFQKQRMFYLMTKNVSIYLMIAKNGAPLLQYNSVMDVRCPYCNHNYSALGGGQEPRVLACGDSCCSKCLRSLTQKPQAYEFQCIKCNTLNPREYNFPLNKLYYEMQAYFKQHLKRREWDSPSLAKADDDGAGRQLIRYDEKCLNPFCVRPRYQYDDVVELFCSKMCKTEHQNLYQP